MNSDIKSRYEKICPRTKWSDEEIRTNFFVNIPTCKSSNVIDVDNDDEMKKILEDTEAILLEDFISTLRNQ